MFSQKNLLSIGGILASGDHHGDAGIDTLFWPLGREVVELHVLAEVIEEHIDRNLIMGSRKKLNYAMQYKREWQKSGRRSILW